MKLKDFGRSVVTLQTTKAEKINKEQRQKVFSLDKRFCISEVSYRVFQSTCKECPCSFLMDVGLSPLNWFTTRNFGVTTNVLLLAELG